MRYTEPHLKKCLNFRSPGPSSSIWYTEEDNKALDSLYCKICEVRLHDRGSMKERIEIIDLS